MFFPENLETKNTYLKIPGASRQDRCSVRARNLHPMWPMQEQHWSSRDRRTPQRPGEEKSFDRRFHRDFFHRRRCSFGGVVLEFAEKTFRIVWCPFFFCLKFIEQYYTKSIQIIWNNWGYMSRGALSHTNKSSCHVGSSKIHTSAALRWGCTRGASFGAGTKVSCRTATNRRAFVDGFGIY